MQIVRPKWLQSGLVLVCERCFKERIPQEDPEIAVRIGDFTFAIGSRNGSSKTAIGARFARSARAAWTSAHAVASRVCIEPAAGERDRDGGRSRSGPRRPLSRDHRAPLSRFEQSLADAALLKLELGEVLFDLALHALQRVVDRLDVAAEIARHLLVALAFEVRLEHLRLELGEILANPLADVVGDFLR